MSLIKHQMTSTKMKETLKLIVAQIQVINDKDEMNKKPESLLKWATTPWSKKVGVGGTEIYGQIKTKYKEQQPTFI